MLILVFAFALVFLVPANVSVFRKRRNAYRQGKITRGVFARNVAVEIFGILLAMTLAGLLGRHVSQVATVQISHNLTRIMAGILIGVLVGAGVGLFMKRTWGRLTKVEQF